MRREYRAQRLAVFIGEQDMWSNRPLYAALVNHLKEAGIAGVTALRGVEGFGTHHTIHTARLNVPNPCLPIVILAVDTPEQIAKAMAIVESMVHEGTVTVDDVTAIAYQRDEPGGHG
ncbi:MAG: DUF190 domain-containing protein [Capsulimonadaceae bacterium]